MKERYSRLFVLPQSLYTESSPVVIVAGALLKDNSTNGVLAQLKFRNISSKPIKAISVKVFPLDTVGDPLGTPVKHQYLDLMACRDDEFCQKIPILLPDNTTRSFHVSVTKVIFADNAIWDDTGNSWEVLPLPQKLEIKDAELLKQYRMEYGADCNYVSSKVKDLWYCACGALNRRDEDFCYKCKKSFSIISNVDMEALAEKCNERLEKEKQAREESERIAAEKAAEKEAKARARAKKIKKAIIIVLSAMIVCIAIALLITNLFIPLSHYNEAKNLFSAGQYEEAKTAFEAQSGYKDSASYIQYAEALELMNKGDYSSIEKAKTKFDELVDFKDSKQKVEECNDKLTSIASKSYKRALAFMDEKKYKEAYVNFGYYPDYSDSSEKMLECLKNLFSEAVSLYDDGEYRSAFSKFEYCMKNDYSVNESTDYIEKCNDSYKNDTLNGRWIKLDASYPLYSEKKYITVTNIQYRYNGNTIEFSVDYSITKNDYTDAFYCFTAKTKPYYTDIIDEKLNLNGSEFSFSVDYENLMNGFITGRFSEVELSIDYQMTENFYASINHTFTQKDLERLDLFGNKF